MGGHRKGPEREVGNLTAQGSSDTWPRDLRFTNTFRSARPTAAPEILADSYRDPMGWGVQGTQTFAVKGQRVNILAFAGHMVSVATARLRLCIAEAAADSMQTNRHGCLPIKLYLQKRAAEFSEAE